MTFSIAAKCLETGMFGCAITTTNMACGSRAIFAKAGTGAVLSQSWSNPGLGPVGIQLLSEGKNAEETIKGIVKADRFPGWRQLAVVDRDGKTAVHHGDKITSIKSHATAPGAIAAGNGIVHERVSNGMIEGYLRNPKMHFGYRLLHALDGGVAAGGQAKQLHSAALLIVDDLAFPIVDLRVELDSDPLTKLRFLWEIYRPQIETYRLRAMDPGNAPSPDLLV